MATKEKHDCSERVFSGALWDSRGHSCPRNGTIERNGKWYCYQHDPEAVRLRREEWERKYKERWAKVDAAEARARLVRQRSRQAIEALRFLAIFRYPADHPQVISARQLIERIDAERILDDLED